MKSVVAIIGFFALTAYPASFAVGAENDRVEIRVSDADSKAPLGSVLAVGRQFYFTPGAFHHGPDPVCFREDAASSNQDGRIEMRLPQLAEYPRLRPA